MGTGDTPPYNQGSYNFEQQTFCMSWATILSFNLKGTASKIEEQTKAKLLGALQDDEIRKLIGVWDLVWGPAVYADSYVGRKESLNCMFIVAPREHPELALISISGTNGTSLMDWVVEDFDVGVKVPWPYGTPPSDPHISRGTSFGLDKLVAMESRCSKSGSVMSARDFLAGGSFNEVMVTGHSLGGALSPCYALYLDETRSEWDSAEGVKISCLATAGPTAGDKSFSEYYDGRLGDTTHRVWNSLDVVPHAFEAETLGKVPSLYEPDLRSGLADKAVAALLKQTQGLDYLSISPATPGFPSEFYRLDEFAGEYQHVVDEFEQLADLLLKFLMPFKRHPLEDVSFIVQALIQHTIGYIVHFDIADFNMRLTKVTKDPAPMVSDHASLATRLKDVLT